LQTPQLFVIVLKVSQPFQETGHLLAHLGERFVLLPTGFTNRCGQACQAVR